MADEEHPFGGGPFGQGPFGPLVPAAAAAAAAFCMVVVTAATPVTRTLFYQANIAPPPQTPVVPQVAEAKTFSITTGEVRSKSLFYQSRIGPPPVAAAADNTGSFATWYVPLSRPLSRLPTETALYTPFVPQAAPQPTADKWLQPFKRQVAGPFPVHTQPTYPYAAPAVSNLTTTLEWMVAWQGPKRPLLPLAGGVVNVPLPSNLTTTLEWLATWRGPPRPIPAQAGGSPFIPKEAVLENTVTPDAWMPRWQGPPSYHPAPAGGSPFVPKEATAENTQTPDKWLRPFIKAVPTPSARPTQPFYGYPYEAAVVDNTVTIDKWLQPLGTVPPRYLQPIVGRFTYPPAGPTVATLTTTLDWLRPWQGPPNYNPAPQGGSPFVAKEAVLENTVTPDKWLVRFAKAVPAPKPVPTQPEYRYPYETQAIVVPYEQWWHQPLSRAAQRPQVHAKPYQPFVPREAVRENTQTPDKWLARWQGPPRITPIKVQTPPFVPREATAENTVTPDKWHRDLGRAAARPPVMPTQPGWSYAPAVVDNTVTIEKWQQPLGRAVATPKARPTQPLYVTIKPEAAPETFTSAEVLWKGTSRRSLFYQAQIQPPLPAAVVENTVTPDKWMRPLGIAAKRPAVWPTQPFFGYPYVQLAIEPPWAVEVTTQFVFSRTLYYQSHVAPVPTAADAVEGGPADEPERVICLLEHSRVAVVPEVLRVATVPIDLRVATVPELSRTVEVLLSDREEESNLSTALPCAGAAAIPEPEEPEDHAFQVDDAFQDDAFQ